MIELLLVLFLVLFFIDLQYQNSILSKIDEQE
jgi:hypothetical protein